jgi:hypothetical protein
VLGKAEALAMSKLTAAKAFLSITAYVWHRTYHDCSASNIRSAKSVHLLCRVNTHAAPPLLSFQRGAVKTFCVSPRMRQEIQGAALQLLPDHARPPRLSSPPLIRAAGCVLHITGSLLCPRATKQEYDQVTLMFTAPGFSKQTVFPMQIDPEDCCLPAQMNSPSYRSPKYPT